MNSKEVKFHKPGLLAKDSIRPDDSEIHYCCLSRQERSKINRTCRRCVWQRAHQLQKEDRREDRRPGPEQRSKITKGKIKDHLIASSGQSDSRFLPSREVDSLTRLELWRSKIIGYGTFSPISVLSPSASRMKSCRRAQA